MKSTRDWGASAPSDPVTRLRDLYDEHFSYLFRLSLLLSGDRYVAEDLAQEAFVRAALGRLVRLNDSEAHAYLRATCLNLWRNRMRRRRLEARAKIQEALDEQSPAPSGEEQTDLWLSVRSLPPRQRACIALRYYEDLTERETAALLHCSIGTVKSQTSRAIARLRKELTDG